MNWLSYFTLGLNLVAILGALVVIVRLRLKRKREDRKQPPDHEDSEQ